MGVFSLTGWSRQIHTGFHVSRATQDTTTPYQYHGKGLSPAMAELSRTFPDTSTYDSVVLQPRNCRNNCGLGSSPVARHYWGNHSYFLFLQVLRCFSSLRSPPYICVDDRPSGGRVVPFGNRRITGHLHLPDAYRSLSRPSSPARA